jgi:hypothetical protein
MNADKDGDEAIATCVIAIRKVSALLPVRSQLLYNQHIVLVSLP